MIIAPETISKKGSSVEDKEEDVLPPSYADSMAAAGTDTKGPPSSASSSSSSRGPPGQWPHSPKSPGPFMRPHILHTARSLRPPRRRHGRRDRSQSPVPATKPTNYVSQVKLNGSLKGSWLIDPRILIPAPLLPPLDRGETESTRKNFYLKSHNGKVSADVTLLPSKDISSASMAAAGSSQQREYAVFGAETLNGSVTFALHDALGAPDTVRLPVKIKLSSCNGGITIFLPRSFRGIIVGQSTWGSIKTSPDVSAHLQYSKQEGALTKLFIGEFDDTDFAQETWSGDEVKAETMNGNVVVKYDDEEDGEGLALRKVGGPVGLIVGLVTWAVRLVL